LKTPIVDRIKCEITGSPDHVLTQRAGGGIAAGTIPKGPYKVIAKGKFVKVFVSHIIRKENEQD